MGYAVGAAHVCVCFAGAGLCAAGTRRWLFTPPAERARVLRIARTLAIPVPVGTTHGSAIAPFGASNAGLSWPGRYSHAPGEVLNLRDVEALIRIIAALAVR